MTLQVSAAGRRRRRRRAAAATSAARLRFADSMTPSRCTEHPVE
jgi:hypothetical protein